MKRTRYTGDALVRSLGKLGYLLCSYAKELTERRGLVSNSVDRTWLPRVRVHTEAELRGRGIKEAQSHKELCRASRIYEGE